MVWNTNCSVSGMMGMPNQGMYNMGFPGNRPPMFGGGGRYWAKDSEWTAIQRVEYTRDTTAKCPMLGALSLNVSLHVQKLDLVRC